MQAVATATACARATRSDAFLQHAVLFLHRFTAAQEQQRVHAAFPRHLRHKSPTVLEDEA